MAAPRGFRDRADDGILTLVGEVPELVRNLVTAEVDSAKGWLKKTGKDAGMGGVWFLVALFCLFWTIPVIGAFIIVLLSLWMPTWVAALILIVALLVLAAIFALLGLVRVKKITNRDNPAKAISVDAHIVKDVADEF